jgi:hypothetical protein
MSTDKSLKPKFRRKTRNVSNQQIQRRGVEAAMRDVANQARQREQQKNKPAAERSGFH